MTEPPNDRATDVHTWIGAFAFRELPHPDPDVLVRVLGRERIASAWTGYLPTAYHRDPVPGNERLYAMLAPHTGVLQPVPVVRPDWPGWERVMADAHSRSVPAVRAYPMQWGLPPASDALSRLAGACAEARTVLLLTVRFEDLRQRHPLDVASDLTPAHVRGVVRASPGAAVVVAAAGREFIEETYWGLTPVERQRVWFDFSWVWGPPEDHFAHLLRTIGPSRFVFGTGWPLRLVQNSRANLDLLPDDIANPGLAHPGDLVALARDAR